MIFQLRSLARAQPLLKSVQIHLESSKVFHKATATYCTSKGGLLEVARQKAAQAAVDAHVKDGDVVGIGSGSMIVYAIEKIAQRMKDEGIFVKCVPTSFETRRLIHSHGMMVTNLDDDPVLDVTIDGVVEADGNLTLIKGGGGCLTQEKVVAEAAKTLVVIGDHRKKVEYLGESWPCIPLEVLPMAYKPVKTRIEREFGGKIELRPGGKAKAGPIISDNGNFIMDWFFDINHLRKLYNHEGNEHDAKVWEEVNSRIVQMAGIVESGLFVNTAKFAYFGLPDGTIQKIAA